MNEEGHGDLGLERLLTWVQGLAKDTENSAFVSVFKTGQISMVGQKGLGQTKA